MTAPGKQTLMLPFTLSCSTTQVFCGNFEYDASERSVLDLFERFGRVQRIDMKTGEPAYCLEGGMTLERPTSMPDTHW